MRAHNISGHTLLNFINNTVLRDDLNIKVFGDRAFIMMGIEWLQQRSPAFLSQKNQGGSQNVVPSFPCSAPVQDPSISKPPRRIQPTPVTKSVPHQQKPQSISDALAGNEHLYKRILQRFPPQPDNHPDVVLMGRSGLKAPDDTESEGDTSEEHTADSAPKSKALSAAEVDSEIDAYVVKKQVKWREQTLPKEQQGARKIWKKREDPILKEAIEGQTSHLKNRLENLRQAIHRAGHNSVKAVHRTCGTMDRTLSDLFGYEWAAQIIRSTQPPGPPPSREFRDTDGNETLGSEDSDSEEEDDNVAEDCEEHAPKRLRTGTENKFMGFDPDIAIPTLEIDELLLPMGEPQSGDNQDPPEPDDYIGMFGRAYPMTLGTITKSGNRELLLAKSLMNLSKNRFDLFSRYLGKYEELVYRSEVQDALIAMAADKLQVEGSDPETNHQRMMLASLFISWVHCVQLSSEKGIPVQQVQATIHEIQAGPQACDEDDGLDEFAHFWLSLDGLVTAHPKWNALARNTSVLSRRKGKRRRLAQSVEDDLQLRRMQLEDRPKSPSMEL
jgi:hypothetical protein